MDLVLDRLGDVALSDITSLNWSCYLVPVSMLLQNKHIRLSCMWWVISWEQDIFNSQSTLWNNSTVMDDGGMHLAHPL